MFLQYAAPGFVIPILSHYLKNYLHFQPQEVGWVLAIPALTGVIAQLLLSRVVDLKISAERLLGLCHLSAGALMIALFYQHDFRLFLLVYGLYGFCFIPTFGLSNAVAFHHLKDPRREFGRIRMWGPVSWVLVGVAFSMLWLRPQDPVLTEARVPQALLFSAATSIVIGVFSMFLPRHRGSSAAALASQSLKQLFLRHDIRTLCIFALLATITHQFYYYAMGPYLSQIGLPDAYLLPALGLGQSGEILVLALLGRGLAVAGFKRTLFIGLLAQVFRFAAFSSGILWLSIAAIPLHGLCYACFFSVAYIYLDTHCDPGNRGGAQQLFNILIVGLGNLLGSIIAGEIASLLVDTETGIIHYRTFWVITCLISTALSGMLLVLFHEEAPQSPVART